MRRREFLKTAGCFLVTAGVPELLGCDKTSEGAAAVTAPSAVFPQGVASGDPTASSVVLWTRVELVDATSHADADISLHLEVATDAKFAQIVARRDLRAMQASDRTVRVLVEGLAPDTVYYYRFSAGNAQSRVGRTWTAPDASADVPIRFAWCSCQDYSGGFYGAYGAMLREDEQRAEAERIRFVLHIGDFIYETRGEGFQMPLDDQLQPVELIDRDGRRRELRAFPSDPSARFASTVDDYRHLYKTFLSDPDLQEARARWPFVTMWDDHEFSDDCWQTQTNYTRESGFDEPSQRRKVAANQAWFEYTPAHLVHDFEPAAVDDAPYTDPIDPHEDNNTRAIATLTTYRTLRFGQHVQIVLTDNRSYRSDHAIDEGVTNGVLTVFAPRGGLPLAAVNAFDAGRTANGGDPPASVAGLTNDRRTSPPGTMLGAEQKQWWMDTLKASSATFKVWGNSVPLLRLRLDTKAVSLFPGDLVLSDDAWDGFPTERKELMKFLQDERIPNVVSLAGDHHAHFAGLVYDDHDAAAPSPVMLDFAAAGISSGSLWGSLVAAVHNGVAESLRSVVEPVVKLIVYDATAFGGPKAVPNLNTLLRYGSRAATVAAMTHDVDQIANARDAGVNPHLRYVDTRSNGYGVARFDASGAQVELVTVDAPLSDPGENGLAERGRAVFRFRAVAAGEDPVLDEPELSGSRPFPLA